MGRRKNDLNKTLWTGTRIVLWWRRCQAREVLMFCSIRQYEGCTDLAALSSRVQKELLPTLRDMPGFQSYLMVEGDTDGDVTTISLFDTETHADEANEQVAELVKASLSELLPEEPVITVGEVLIASQR
jgi:hypothetical protein